MDGEEKANCRFVPRTNENEVGNRMKPRSNARSKACDIPMSVKERVFERDNCACVICGNMYNVYPGAHYISRNHGGLGIEQNIVTLCGDLTDARCQCHRKYDKGTPEEKAEIGARIKAYLQSKYPDWDEEKLIYRKYG